MQGYQWGTIMFVLCNIAYHVADEQSILPLVVGFICLIIGTYDFFKNKDKIRYSPKPNV